MGNIFSKAKNKVKKYEQLSENSTEDEKRSAEEQLLKPEILVPYPGRSPKFKSELESRTALIVFRDTHQMELIGKLFNIRESVGGISYITNIRMLYHLAQEFIEGRYKIVDEQLVSTADLPNLIAGNHIENDEYTEEINVLDSHISRYENDEGDDEIDISDPPLIIADDHIEKVKKSSGGVTELFKQRKKKKKKSKKKKNKNKNREEPIGRVKRKLR